MSNLETAINNIGAATEAMNDLTDAVNVKKQTLDSSVADAKEARDQSQSWATVAESFSVGAFFMTGETTDLIYLTTNTDTVSVVAQTDDTLTLEIN